MGEARSQLEERAAEVGALRTDLEVRGAGVDERRQFLQRRLAEVEERLAGDGRAAGRGGGAPRRARPAPAGDRPPRGARGRPLRRSIEAELAELRERRRRQSEAARAGGVRARRPAPASGPTPSASSASCASASSAPRSTDAEITLRLETDRRGAAPRPRLRARARRIAAECPPLAEGTTPAARVRELERELRLMGPINPLALQEFEALQERHEFLEAPARRREGVTPRARQDHPGDRRRDRQRVRVGLRRRAAELRAALRHAVPRRPGPAAPDRSRQPARHRHRARGQALGQERAEAVAALRRRAVADRAGVPVRRVPQPPVALLRDGRGRGRARRREPAPLPRPGRTSSATTRSSSS